MSLLKIVLLGLLLAGLGVAWIAWAIVDVRRGYNFSDSEAYDGGRHSRDRDPVSFWYSVALKAGFGVFLIGIAACSAFST